MAYPNPIPSTNIGVTKDFLEYFKGCLTNYILHENTEDYDDRWVAFITEFQALPNLPISRANFYTLIRNNFPQINGEYIYNYDQTNVSWSRKMANDWGKLKAIEQALFGNTTGTAGNSMASVNGTKFLESIPKWTSASMTYLRFGLCRFDTYGLSGFSQSPPPTNPNTNVEARTFTWTNAIGYPNLSDYEYIYRNDLAYKVVTQKPIQIPGNKSLNYNDLKVRTRANGYSLSSDSIGNEKIVEELTSKVTIDSIDFIPDINPKFQVSFSLSREIQIQFVLFFNLTYTYLGENRSQYASTEFDSYVEYWQTDPIPFEQEVNPATPPTNMAIEIVSASPNPADGIWIEWDNN